MRLPVAIALIVLQLDPAALAQSKGDPGLVLARRLSNAEYDYTIRDLTGVDIRPAREFPVDPSNMAGFENSGESLVMSPALVNKYLQAARQVANHLVLKPAAIAFAPHLALVETDRDRYCINQIIDFYHRQNIDYRDYFHAAWRYKHRARMARPKATLAAFAAESQVSSKYLATIWDALETNEGIGPLAKLQAMWHALPAPRPHHADLPKAAASNMRDFVVQLRQKIATRVQMIENAGINEGVAMQQPFLMWRNWRYARNRRNFDRSVLQVEGEAIAGASMQIMRPVAAPETLTMRPRPAAPDADLYVPRGQRERYEAAFARFAAVFPDAFYVSARGRYFPLAERDSDVGRYLSAGFHHNMGYFRDDQPLYELILDEKQQKELDGYWRDLDFVAAAQHRTYAQFYLASESGAARNDAESGLSSIDVAEIVSEDRIRKAKELYLARVRPSGNTLALEAVEQHFAWLNENFRWLDKAHAAAEPIHLAELLKFAARAYRRPLTRTETDGLLEFYSSLRGKSQLPHEEAMRDLVVRVLMSPNFLYLVDLAGREDYALASRLSYFLWSSMPDAQLLSRAAAGELRRSEVLAAEARRMLKDDRVRGLANQFGGSWLDFRRFEEHNAVDRERFPVFTNELRQAMFEEPVRFMLDVFQENRSVLDFLYANHTFVNPVLATHYGIPGVTRDWTRVDDARKYGRGGLMPMSVFLTKNASGLRTSPVKRGHWVVKQILGEQIPPPPAAVPELPRDEAKMAMPLGEMLARHRENKACASCHARFDALGLVFEGYGPVGERRMTDLSGRPVDASAAFPGGAIGSGVEGLRSYVKQHRQNDFLDNLSRKLLAYALGRSLIAADRPTIDALKANLAANGYRFDTLIEGIVTSRQFMHKRETP